MGLGLGLHRRVRDGIFWVEGEVDSYQLRRRLHEVLSADQLANAVSRLTPAYTEYVSKVSSPGMAASLETSAVLFALAEARRPRRSLYLGSGFSSYVLRLAAEPYNGEVVSIDDNEDWIEATRTFLSTHGVVSNDVRQWSTFEPSPTFDLVFHDLANGELRNAAASIAAQCVSPSGVIVFDDMQHRPHSEAAKRACAEQKLRPFSLRSITLDQIDRWSMIGIR